MKKYLLFLLSFVFTCVTEGQVVQIQAGTAFSKMNGQDEATRVGYSLFAGINYLDRPSFNLSSHVGVIRKGGREMLAINADGLLDNDGKKILSATTTLDYLSINTTLDLKVPLFPNERNTLFLSAGPRIDCLFNSRVSEAILEGEREASWNRFSAGLLLGMGVRFEVSRFVIGVRGDYYANFVPLNTYRKVNTFNVHLTVGYQLFL